MSKSKAAASGSGGGGGGGVECRLCHRRVPPGVVCAKLDFRGKPGEGRPKIDPLKPMKGFFWKTLKLDASDLDPASNKSVWSIVTEMMFDYDEFELLFQKKAGVEKKVEERKGPLVRTVLSPVRSGAIIALLGYLRVGVDQLIEAIEFELAQLPGGIPMLRTAIRGASSAKHVAQWAASSVRGPIGWLAPMPRVPNPSARVGS